jgi:pimeloyl-ACP methyl ester carboxylesterase
MILSVRKLLHVLLCINLTKIDYKMSFNHKEGFESIRLVTERGHIDCRCYYPYLANPVDKEEEAAATQQSAAAIFVTGVGGGWGTPAEGLYPRLCNSLAGEGITGLRIRYRHPTDLAESVFDVLAGISYLKQQQRRLKSVGLVGHSFGGAVVIQAAALASDVVSTVVTIATQSYGATDAMAKLRNSRRISLLLIHGTNDNVLPVYCSEQIYQLAHEPKRLEVYRGAGHSLDEVSEEVYRLVNGWMVQHLKSS